MTITGNLLPSSEKSEPTSASSHSSSSDTLKDVDIPHNGADSSTYSKFLALYCRSDKNDTFKSLEEKQNCKFGEQWPTFVDTIAGLDCYGSEISGRVTERILPAPLADKFTNNLGMAVKISEYTRDDECQIRGCVTTIENENTFNNWFIYHILDQSRLSLSEHLIVDKEVKYHELFADFFEKNLKNTIVNDQWDFGGRDYFIERARYFTDRYLRIECILPAFPCKSSNEQKVYGSVPDKGEELALKRLIKATQDLVEVYPPGMKIWIVSDGHVFSDCIGVDDDVVSEYTTKLHELYGRVAIPGVDAIGFCGLNELFFSGAASEIFNPNWVSDTEVAHYTGTQICPKSDLSRQILMKGCDTDAGRLRKQIAIDGHPRLHLYRGFSRFMMEDLSLLEHFQSFSKKKFKKVISMIAFNMIKRNDAYSNLVELIFPHHLRISIHAHTNSGPKFGIKVISSEQCSIVSSLEDLDEPKFEDFLHIPTPWHNCVVKVEDDKEKYFLTKSKVIKDAIEKGSYDGEWKDTRFDIGEGGHFVIRKTS
ncbi:Dit1p SKDI_04G6120 [Saccharomyces kudriavzevii IFO 1802]|uniref:DIT1-like protein n=1 Tax=Saccharomyces kudriavzevii (strain ATCC MYA-4449 / AS 2.2408 / CBS 8840 / NBRC 1802 / NCYC 2889) TaxID=226230 RepID=A0AA35JEL9_SACK1|nr:uncharacterized protein SKDI_04G6120 [Saccharomyces kudriavzevii IFO 1802]CAI4059172.1 hypothetical protein SKDI_04G6120 [Saccharomyces kudriavzevii IFO 1802]